MNRPLMEALAAVTTDFYCDALQHYPSLRPHSNAEPDDEARVVSRVLLAIDDLAVAVQAAIAFDDPPPVITRVQEKLPF